MLIHIIGAPFAAIDWVYDKLIEPLKNVAAALTFFLVGVIVVPWVWAGDRWAKRPRSR